MNDKDKKFTVISNKKVIKRFAAVVDSNVSTSSEKINESKQEPKRTRGNWTFNYTCITNLSYS